MEKLLICIQTIFVCYSISAQNLAGKWYLINRGSLIEMNISKDKITTRQLSIDFKVKNTPPQVDTIYTILKLTDRILLVIDSKTGSGEFAANTLIDLQPKRSFQLVWNSLDTTTSSIEELQVANTNDKRKLFGYYFFNTAGIAYLKKLKALSTMTLGDFKKYAATYVKNLNATIGEFEKYNAGYAAVTYNFQLIVESLVQVGYNPLVEMKILDNIYKRYGADPEVKKILQLAKTK